ncbi:4Fe-4S dicluster domain-containing protein [Candidatus Enterococcus clewellii]|uniref:4Fe-4S ferredoxin-type domain-containing protein n=1 Tax=Candidatus Enterococcus clewellii TaxID=1834193 RepID=A0A242KDH4_9ENTE|nr:4Fe-4S dicluster domain-containing protein [Enterococcus sp. 9E7_DIV0242]OTP18838.1 hypothetical protein A5888_000652 [Enterococcus sp. 9E7_DIV0242]
MLLEQITEAGIVGCGGAGFPTAVKLNAKAEYLIVNAAECEPLLKTDHYIMNQFADECIEAIYAVGKAIQADSIIIATKAHYFKEIAALNTAIQRVGVPISIFEMDNFYPAGDEQVMVYEVTGRVVEPGGIPLSVGCIVSNIATMLNIYQAAQGTPVTHKYLTVTGAVARPTILHVPIGTSFTECLRLAGGSIIPSFMYINGGPMMGKAGKQEDFDQQLVTKTTSGIIILEPRDFIHELLEKDLKQVINTARSSCIQCRLCTELCPRFQLGHPIHPHRVMRHLAITEMPEDIEDDPIWQEALLCCECGVCEVVACPMGLMPRQVNTYVKKKLAEKGIRRTATNVACTPAPLREYQKVPPRNILLKNGLKEYEGLQINDCISYEPEKVTIPLAMHIGAPSIPTVTLAQTVTVGTIIATVPEKSLGAQIHASISGTVTAISDQQITIERMSTR